MSAHAPARRRSAMRLTGLAAALALLAGCEPYTNGSPYIARSSYSTGPSERLYDLRFQPGGADLAAGELQRIQGILGSLGLRQGDAIFVRLGVTGNGVLDQERVTSAAYAVAGTPARVQVLGAPVSPTGGGRFDVALVEVVRHGRLRVICPTPQPDSWEPDALLVDPPPGCVNALNIANMAASPRDLLSGRPLGASGAVMDVAAVDRYWTNKVKWTPLYTIANSSGN